MELETLHKVLFFDHSLEMGGSERSLFDIISGIRSFIPVFVTPSTKLLSKFSSIGIRCIYFPMPLKVLKRKRDKPFAFSDTYNLPPIILRFVMVLKKEKPSIVYTNTQKSHLIGVIGSRIARIPCILHFRDVFPRSIFTRTWLHLLCLPATRIIAISKAVARELPYQTKIKVIYNGIKLTTPNLQPTIHNSKTVGYVGQIARWKGIEYFIEAASLVVKEIPTTNFVIVGGPIFGDTKYLNEIKELTDRLGMDSKIQFVGEKEEVLPYINSLDILVHPPIAPEPFGRVLIEAGALGKPIIATNIGAIPEIVEDGVTGVLVPPKDYYSIATAIKKLINTPGPAKSMGERGRERVAKHFNFDTMIKEIEQVIKRLNT